MYIKLIEENKEEKKLTSQWSPGQEVEYKKRHLNIKKRTRLSYIKPFRHWHTEYVKSPSLEILKAQLDMALN